jgi:hypothetical protein
VPAVWALGEHLRLARALRPLKRKTGSRHKRLLDENATANSIAENGIWIPTMRPAPTRWLELAVVVDGYESMSIWGQMVNELRHLLEGLGAFSDVRFWVLTHAAGDPSCIGVSRWKRGSPLRSAQELADPTGRRLIIVLSDCLGPSWRLGAAQRVLDQWGKSQPVAILQPLPQRLWSYTYVRPTPVRLRAMRAGTVNAHLAWRRPARLEDTKSAPVPVLELDADWLASWTRLINASGASGVDAMAVFADRTVPYDEKADAGIQQSLTPDDRVRRFRSSASPEAIQLAVYLAAAPISLPVIRLVQQVMLDDPKQSQLAEVFLGGLLGRKRSPEAADPDSLEYDFLPGVREILLARLGRNDALKVLLEVSDFVDLHFGQARDFRALLAGEQIAGDQPISPGSLPFAIAAERVLRQLGGHYTASADRLALARSAAPEITQIPVDAEPASTSLALEEPTDRSLPELTEELPAGRSRSRPMVCPYCYKAFSEGAILFRCENPAPLPGTKCELRVDSVLEEVTGQSEKLPPVFPRRGRTAEMACPNCKVLTRTQVCPGCHSTLPAHFHAVQGRLIALVGPSYSGKTLFMTVLLHELRHGAGQRLSASAVGADDTSKDRFTNEYEIPLYRRHLTLEETRTAAQRNVQPLVFRFIMDQKSRFRQRKRELMLSFADGAGADLISPLKIELVTRYLAAADGVLALVDPLQLPRVREQLADQGPIPRLLKRDQQPVAAFERVSDLLLRASGGTTIDKPVAIVLTKLDTIRDLLPRDSVLRTPEPDGPYFDAKDSKTVQEEVREMLNSWGAGRINESADTLYRRARYFAVSSLGQPPTPDNRISPSGINPYRVTDPFIWLLNEFSFIPSR